MFSLPAGGNPVICNPTHNMSSSSTKTAQPWLSSRQIVPGTATARPGSKRRYWRKWWLVGSCAFLGDDFFRGEQNTVISEYWVHMRCYEMFHGWGFWYNNFSRWTCIYVLFLWIHQDPNKPNHHFFGKWLRPLVDLPCCFLRKSFFKIIL